RWPRDWSSDVCSSDLAMFNGELRKGAQLLSEALEAMLGRSDRLSTALLSGFLAITYSRLGEFAAAEKTLERSRPIADQGDEIARSEERRGGEEGGVRG